MVDDGLTYQAPDKEQYFKKLLAYLELEGRGDIISLLKGGKCYIETSSKFSYRRWDHFWSRITFEIPTGKIKLLDEKTKNDLLGYCQEVMPPDAGYDVMEVKFIPLVDLAKGEESLTQHLEESIEVLSEKLKAEILPEDIMEKASEMEEVYTYLYCVENSLRIFIERVSREHYGENYYESLNLNRDMKNKIKARKRDEEKHKWLRARGDSNIFYLDFEDLGSIIRNNWNIFKTYFPSQEWIFTKIEELSKCRNPVAHNSYLEKDEREVIKVNFNQILKQIAKTLERIRT